MRVEIVRCGFGNSCFYPWCMCLKMVRCSFQEDGSVLLPSQDKSWVGTVATVDCGGGRGGHRSGWAERECGVVASGLG